MNPQFKTVPPPEKWNTWGHIKRDKWVRENYPGWEYSGEQVNRGKAEVVIEKLKAN